MSRSAFIWSILCVGIVFGLFVIKQRVQHLEAELENLNAEIITNRDATEVLKAEWSYLNEPARLEDLSKRLLNMKTPKPEQFITLEELVGKERLADNYNYTPPTPVPLSRILTSSQKKISQKAWLLALIEKLKSVK